METNPQYIDLSLFQMDPSFRGRSALVVQLWWLVQDYLIRPSPQFMYGWRRFWWRIFGSQVGEGVLIRPTVKVTYPWKVKIGAHSWIGDYAELYSLGPIEIGCNTVVSQHVYLCAGTHDYKKIDFPLVANPIHIEEQVWIATGCFVAPGVTIGKGAIIAAKSVVLHNLPSAMICAGQPARPIKERPNNSTSMSN